MSVRGCQTPSRTRAHRDVPVLPDTRLGTTVMPSSVRPRWALKVDLIVPESNWKGAASAPVGVTGAGSNAVPHASLSAREP